MKKICNVAIVGADAEEYLCLKEPLDLKPCGTDFSVTQEDASALYLASEKADLVFYCQEEAAAGADHLPSFVGKTILVTSCYDKSVLEMAFRKGVAYVLYRPLNTADILLAVENVLFFSQKYLKENSEDGAVLSFLQGVAESGVPLIEPVASPFKPNGHFYPDILNITRELENEEVYLDALSERGFFVKRLRNRVRLCSRCSACQVNYREICPVCSSIDIVRGQMIHHFQCGHVDALENFSKGSDLICPKCDQTLRHIGIDYEKPSDYFKCSECHAIVPEPTVELECLVCGLTCAPGETQEKNIYSYEFTEFAWEAVRSGKILGVDLTSILYDRHTNLFNKQYFEIELKRELIRMKRYKSSFTLVFARIENIAEIQKNQPDRVFWYLNSLFKALTQGLRELDTTCVWESNILGLILSETNQDGALVVVERMHQKMQSLEYLFDVARPEVTFGVIQGDETHASSEQITALAMKDLTDE